MASRRSCGLFVLLGVVSGCTAIRPLDPEGDAGGGRDAFVGTVDTGGVDAFVPPVDVGPGNDAWTPDDVGTDAASIVDAGTDAAVIADAGPDAADANCPVYYRDEDRDNYGADATATMFCTPPGLPTWVSRGGDCDDTERLVRPGQREECNAIDDDCNGLVDDGPTTCGTSCQVVAHAGETYLFCQDNRTRDIASMQCASMGYHLVDIADMAENDFVMMEAMARGLGGGGGGAFGGIWIGLMETGMPATAFTWTDGSIATYVHWDTGAGEPNSNGPCVRMRPLTGLWADQLCSQNYPYVCEAP